MLSRNPPLVVVASLWWVGPFMVGFATALNPPYLLKPEPRSPISIRLAVADVRGNGRDGVDHGVLVQQPDGLRPGRDGGEREHSGSGFDGGVNVKRRNAETQKRRNTETSKSPQRRRGICVSAFEKFNA